jgi:hypothetical protein
MVRGLRFLLFLTLAWCGMACHSPSAQSRPAMAQPEHILRKVAQLTPDTYDPQVLLDGANALLPLGRNAILDAIDAHLAAEKADFSSFGLFVLLRVLFEPPAGGTHPVMYIGQPDVAAPEDLAWMPAFPIVWMEGIPLNLVGGYMLGGLPEGVDAHVAHFRAEGQLRTRPIQPGDKSRCLTSLGQLWQGAYGAALPDVIQGRIQAQLAGLR